MVYRARDAKLGRDVAIKTLPEDVAADPERLARFEREARMLAALNHPNIATVYGFEQADAAHLLAMEVVEGATLADRIERGPIPLEQALPLFIQIAEGLEAAHAKGIIHRDLKPANIKIEAGGGSGTRPGAVKILDFGLAKALAPSEGAAQAAGASHSPTLTLQATMRGELSAPPRTCRPSRPRANLPMSAPTSGRSASACSRRSPGDAYSAAPTRRGCWPRCSRTSPTSPRCRPRHRRRCGDCCGVASRRTATGVFTTSPTRGSSIEEAMAMPAAETAFAAAPAPRRMPRSWIAIAAAALLALGAAGALLVERSLHEAPAPAPAARFVLNPPPNAASGQARLSQLAITADGKAVVYVAGTAQGDVLFVRRIDRLDGAAIPGVEPSACSPLPLARRSMDRLRPR